MLCGAGIVLLSSDKTSIHLWVNDLHTPITDVFFKYWTYVGDGVFVAIAGVIIAIVLFPRYKSLPLWFGACTLILSGALAQVLKRLVFEDALRPSAYLSEYKLHFVEGVQLHASHSFPSGHTTAAFAFFGFAALFLAQKNTLLQVLFALSAGLVGYSRMYLSQHFLEDVLAGMILGTVVFVLLIIAFKRPLAPLNLE
jgi:membrane-associated phospholipid phosphatase